MFACAYYPLPFMIAIMTLRVKCIARKVPELCKSYTPGKTDQDIHVRLARLEQIVEAALPHYWSQGNGTPASDGSGPHDRHRSESPADDGNRSPVEDEDPSGGYFESGRWYGKSASGLVTAPAVLEQVSISGSAQCSLLVT